MANLQLIKALAMEKNISMDALAKELGITPQALSKLMRLNSTKIDTLERIAEKLKVSPCVFFGDSMASASDGSISVNGNENNVNQVDKFMALLEKKDEQIDRLLTLLEKGAVS